MPEPAKCKKCGGTNVTTSINKKREIIGKCQSCKAFNYLGKVSASGQTEAPKKESAKPAKKQTASASRGSAATERTGQANAGKRRIKPAPVPYTPPARANWWDDLFSIFD